LVDRLIGIACLCIYMQNMVIYPVNVLLFVSGRATDIFYVAIVIFGGHLAVGRLLGIADKPIIYVDNPFVYVGRLSVKVDNLLSRAGMVEKLVGKRSFRIGKLQSE